MGIGSWIEIATDWDGGRKTYFEKLIYSTVQPATASLHGHACLNLYGDCTTGIDLFTGVWRTKQNTGKAARRMELECGMG